MDENRIAGTARNVGGKAEEAFGRATGNAKTETEGTIDRMKGTAQDFYGQARDGAAEVAGSAKNAGASLEQLLRTTIERQPYTATAVALGVGWFLGRFRRPL
jgi:uncharacterized protein YjbJ (UPF0337 family)